MVVIAIFIGVYIALFITVPFIILFHELGHAFAHLILTKPDKVDVFIGSYGETEKALNFRVLKFNFYIKYNFPIIKLVGLCRSYKVERDYKKYLIVLFAGPVFTVIAAIIIGLISFNTGVHGSIKLFSAALIFFSIISLVSNLQSRTFKTKQGEFDTDGKQIRFIFKLKNFYPDYLDAKWLIAEQKYTNALEKLEEIVKMVPDEYKVLILLTHSLLETKQYDKAEIYLSVIKENLEITPMYLLLKGYLKSKTNKSTEAVILYRSVLKYDINNVVALNNLSYELIEQGEYEEAEQLLKKGIKINPNMENLTGSMGYLKILEGDKEAGKELINKCLEMNDKNAYAYKALGVYFLRSDNKELARENFNRAKEFESDIDLSPYWDELNIEIA
jgi:Flp pilus assembly protein TadD